MSIPWRMCDEDKTMKREIPQQPERVVTAPVSAAAPQTRWELARIVAELDVVESGQTVPLSRLVRSLVSTA